MSLFCGAIHTACFKAMRCTASKASAFYNVSEGRCLVSRRANDPVIRSTQASQKNGPSWLSMRGRSRMQPSGSRVRVLLTVELSIWAGTANDELPLGGTHV